MKLPRRRLLYLAAAAFAVPVASRTASAQAYPTRPLTMVPGRILAAIWLLSNSSAKLSDMVTCFLDGDGRRPVNAVPDPKFGLRVETNGQSSR